MEYEHGRERDEGRKSSWIAGKSQNLRRGQDYWQIR